MIHYHGTPMTPESAAAQVLRGRHAMVSFEHPEQLPLVAEICQSFVLDNGAFSAWRSGKPKTDWEPFTEWMREWRRHPGFDWFLVPDVIDGTEAQNDALIDQYRDDRDGVPIWHLHESMDRLGRLVAEHKRVAFGSSGAYAQIGTDSCWHRMGLAMAYCCDEQGRPLTKLHGLRMLDPRVFRKFPFASADSTNAARNIGFDSRWEGPYAPPSKAGRGIVIAERIEAHQSAPAYKWSQQSHLLFEWKDGESV
jgi:hypothetical protein